MFLEAVISEKKILWRSSFFPKYSKFILEFKNVASLGTFPKLLVEPSCETGLFRHLSDDLFEVRNYENTKAMRVIVFFKMLKIFKNAAKNWE